MPVTVASPTERALTIFRLYDSLTTGPCPNPVGAFLSTVIGPYGDRYRFAGPPLRIGESATQSFPRWQQPFISRITCGIAKPVDQALARDNMPCS